MYFYSLYEVNIIISILILLILVLRALFLQKLPKRIFCILWFVVVIRLILPSQASFDIGVSLWSDLSNFFMSDRSGNVLVQPTAVQSNYAANGGNNYAFSYAPMNDQIQTNIYSVWLIVFIIIILIFMISYIRTLIRFRFSIPCKNSYIDQWLSRHTLKRKINLRISDQVSTPLTFGVFHPTIMLPCSLDLKDTLHLDFVLAHEYCHIKRLDSLWKILLTVALSIHWFNPLVWIMFFWANRDIEIACDEKVINTIGCDMRGSYAKSLIEMGCKKRRVYVFSNYFSENAIRERIIAIMQTKTQKYFVIILSVVFVIVFSCMAFAKDKIVLKLDPNNNSIVIVATDVNTDMTYGYNRWTGEELISANGGKEWNSNNYFDSDTGLMHKFDRINNTRFVSPDNGISWYGEFFSNPETNSMMCINAESGEVVESINGGKSWEKSSNKIEWYTVAEYTEQVDKLLADSKLVMSDDDFSKLELEYRQLLDKLKGNEIKIGKNVDIIVNAKHGALHDIS